MRGAFIGIDLACSRSLSIVRWVVGSRLRFLTFIGDEGRGCKRHTTGSATFQV